MRWILFFIGSLVDPFVNDMVFVVIVCKALGLQSTGLKAFQTEASAYELHFARSFHGHPI